MRLRFLAPMILVACSHAALPRVTTQTTTTAVAPSIAGHVFDENGKPLAAAHLTPIGADGRELPHVPVAPDGSFELPIQPAQRITRFRVVGAGHRPQMIIVAPEDGAIEVTVKLGVYPTHIRPDLPPDVFLIGDNGAALLPMTKESDGTYSFHGGMPDGTYKYDIVGVVPLHFIAGAENAGWVDPKIGEDLYRPQVTVTGGKVRITFDPRTIVPPVATSVVFARPDSASAGLTDVQRRLDKTTENVEAIVDRFLKNSRTPTKEEKAQASDARNAEFLLMRNDLAAMSKAARLPIVRQAALVAYFHDARIKSATDNEKTIARQALDEVAVDNPLWGIGKSFIHALNAAERPSSSELRDAFIAKQPVSTAIAQFIMEQLEATNDEAERRNLVAVMKSERFHGLPEQLWASAYEPDRVLATGKSVSFDVKPLDENTKTNLTPKSFAGKVLLLDLWDTFCGPCIAAMPELQDLYAKYGGEPKAGHTKRFEILSLGIGESAERVAAFRKDRNHAMPWVHGLVEEDYVRKFAGEGYGIPLFVLIDGEGKIIAGPPDLEIRTLPDVLDRALR